MAAQILYPDEYNAANTREDAKGRFADSIIATLSALGTSQANINTLASVAVVKGDFLHLDLTLPNGHHIGVTAKVVRIQYPQWGRVGGVGVQFVRFSGASQANLELYLGATSS